MAEQAPFPTLKWDQSGSERQWLLDGYNLLHACVLTGRDRAGWWLPEGQARVLAWVDAFAAEHCVVVVFDSGDGAPQVDVAPYHAEVRFVPDADEELVRAAREMGDVAWVVSADRALRDRVKHVGARTMRPWDFAELLKK